MRWCPSKRRSSGTPQLRQPSRPTTHRPRRTPPSRRGWCRIQHHGPNEPGHRRRAAALRDGGPAGRRNRGGPRGLLHVGPNGRRHRGGHRPLLHLGRNGCRHRGGAAEQRPDLERRADVQPAAGQQRAAEPVGGRRPDRQLPEPGRHDPHRIGQLRPQRDLHASGNGRSDHRRHRRPGPVPIPERGGGPGPHRRGPVDLRGGRAGQLRHQQLGDLGHLRGPVQLRRQQPGRFQDHHGSVGFLHPDRSRSRDCQCAGERGSVELLHPGRDAGLRGRRAAGVLRTELDSQLTATFLQYWTSSRTQTEIDDAIAGAGFLTQAQADTRRSAPTEASSPWCAPQ